MVKTLVIAGLLAMFIGGPVAAEAAAPSASRQVLDFEVLRNGDPIGHHRVTITRDGDRTHVDIDIHLSVTFAGVLTLYRYIHKSEEDWQGDRLVHLQSTTDNDGKQSYLKAEAAPGGLQVDGSAFRGLLPASTVPTSYWRSDFVHRQPIMDSQDGHVLDVTIRQMSYEMASLSNTMVPARRYHVSGEFDWQLWYDSEGNWVKTAFKAVDGSSIEYRLR